MHPVIKLVADLPAATRKRILRLLSTAAEPIAVVGMACRFPGGVNSSEALWRLLAERRDAISEVPGGRWDADAYFDRDPSVPGKMNTRWGGFISDVDGFDAAFFGISPREAAHMDPQQRHLLEVAWEALEDAGQPPEQLAGTQAGIFVGIYYQDYASLQSVDEAALDGYSATGASNGMAANRLSFLLDLQGPSMAVDTACSSSLVAVHLACQSLRSEECDVALAGGMSLMFSPKPTIALAKWNVLAPDGVCKVFDDRADGFVRGEGCGVVVLKRLSDALAARDPIRAVIRGSAVNQDGRSNGLTAPNGRAQQRVIRRALAQAMMEASRVEYVEAHGTGTALGDPIELEALQEVIGGAAGRKQRCAVGSVKANIGHLEAAAGIAGLIKTVLVLEHGELLPQAHWETSNRHFGLASSGLKIARAGEAWRGEGPRVAGVSAFGFGGTNAHVVVEEAPGRAEETGDGRGVYILPVAARSAGALAGLASAYAGELRGSRDVGAICYTAAARRSHHREYRLAVVGSTGEELAKGLSGGWNRGAVATPEGPPVVFGMGDGASGGRLGVRHLLAQEDVFREVVEKCAEGMAPELGWSVLAGLAEGGEEEDERRRGAQVLAVQVGLWALWKAWGVEPAAVVGQGVGKLTAAYLCGRMELREIARRLARGWGEAEREDVAADAAAVEALGGKAVWLELGPPSGLATVCGAGTVLASLDAGQENHTAILTSLAALYIRGQAIDWRAVYSHGGSVAPLPAYPWQHQRYWFDGPAAPRPQAVAPSTTAENSPMPYLRNLVAKVLETTADQVEARQPLMAMGLDSLVATELKHSIEVDIGVAVPLVKFLDGSTLSDLAEMISDQRGRSEAASRTVASEEASAPASSAQRRLWLLHMIEPGNAGYNIPLAGRLEGNLNEQALARSLNELVRRHEILRTTFALRGRDLIQIIVPALTIPLPVIDLRELPLSARAAECDRLVAESARQPFDPANGPLLRAALFRFDSADHVLLLNMHHIVSDGWSMRIIAQELAALYRAFAAGLSSPLSEAPMQYSMFARIENDELQKAFAADIGYWRGQLRGAPGALALPVVRPRGGTNHAGARRWITVRPGLTRLLDNECRRQRVTPFTALLAALDILLCRWTGQEDIIIGAPVATRSRPETKDLIGCLINFVPLRIRLRNEQSGAEVIARAREVVLEAMAHQDCPFEKIVEALDQSSPAGRNPIYNVGLVLHAFEEWESLNTLMLDDSLKATFREVETGSALLDLRFLVQSDSEGMKVACEYAADLFTPTVIDALLRSYSTVLEQLLAQPETHVAAFSIDDPGFQEQSTLTLLNVLEELSEAEASLIIGE